MAVLVMVADIFAANKNRSMEKKTAGIYNDGLILVALKFTVVAKII